MLARDEFGNGIFAKAFAVLVAFGIAMAPWQNTAAQMGRPGQTRSVVAASATSRVVQPAAAPATDVTGVWHGNLKSPYDSVADAWTEEVTLTQDSSGNVTGTRLTVPGGSGQKWFKTSVSGTVSGSTMTIADQAVLEQGDPSSSPCLITLTMTLSADGSTFSGPWTSPGCQGGSMSISRYGGQSAAGLGSGAPCDGGLGSTKNGTGSGGGASGNADGSSCAEKLGAAHVGDPIDASTGNFFLQEDDYDGGEYLTFRRFYNSSQTMAPAHMGFHWRHSFDRSLIITGSPTTSVTALRPDGKQETFQSSGDTWTGTTPGDRFAAVKDASGTVTGYTFFVGGVRQTETYDTRGTLLSVTGQDGQGITLAYTTSSTPTVSGVLLTSVTDSKGRVITFGYDSRYRLSYLKFPDGTTESFDYNDSYARMYAAYGSQNVKHYSYNEDGSVGDGAPDDLITSIYDVIGNYESVTYDSQGRATSSSFTGNVGTTKVTYHDGTAPTITYPLGNTVTLGVSTVAGVGRVTSLDAPCGPDCGQRWKSRTYDSLGFPASMTDFRGNTTQMTYDANGLLVHTSEAVGTDAQRNTSTTWDTTLRLPLTRAVSNAKGNVVVKNAWAYNARGQVTAECVIDPSVTANYTCGSQAHAPKGIRQILHTWCDAVNTTTCPLVGLALTIDGPRTDITDVRRFAYYMTTDESGCTVYGGPCHKMGDVSTITDEAGHVTTYVTYDGGGRPTRIKDANGVITDLAYNAGGQLTSRIVRANADGTSSSGDATTTLTYGYRRLLQQVTDPDGVTLTLQYDLANRLTTVTRADRSFIKYTLDAAGNPIKEETYDSSNTLRRSMSRAYNALGQLVSVTDGLGHVVFDATAAGSYDADGNFLGAKDARGTAIRNSYDGLNRLVSSVGDFNGTATATANTQLVTAFDALDNITGVSDPAGLNTLYDHNGLGDLLGTNSPDTGATAFTVDAAGNRLTKTDAKGVATTYTHDALGRVTSASYTDTTLNVAYHYDEDNSVTGCTASAPIGRVTRVVETGVTTSYCYDGRGNVTDKRQTQGTVTDTIHYVYSKADRVLSETRPGGAVVAYERDSLGQVTGVTYTPTPGGSALTVASSIKWLPFGPVQQYVLGNNQSVVRTYDANYRVTDLVAPALELHFVLDAVGNVTGVSESGGGTASYVYDALNRLTTVKDGSGNVIEAYTYNQTGDRLSKTAPGSYTGAYTYKAGTHWLTNMGTASRTYDANGSTTGNVSAGTTTTYVYNGRGRMTSVQVAGATAGTYAYNALDERVAKTVGSTTTRFVYDNASQLVSEASGSTRRDYIAVDGLPLAVADGASLGFITADGLGSPRAVTSAAGTVVWTWPYALNPFGENRATSTTGYVLNLRLPGQYADGEAGLKYNINRSFDAATGRYLESDPMGLAAGPSTYGYVESNPLDRIDPLGLDDSQCIINPPWCGQVHQVNKPFVFGSIEGETSGPVRAGAEGVALAGYNPEDGWSAGVIGALLTAVGTKENYAAGAVGVEKMVGEKATTIKLAEINIGLPLLGPFGGANVGGGYYETENECGVYIHVSGNIIGEHAAVGIGTSTAPTPKHQ